MARDLARRHQRLVGDQRYVNAHKEKMSLTPKDNNNKQQQSSRADALVLKVLRKRSLHISFLSFSDSGNAPGRAAAGAEAVAVVDVAGAVVDVDGVVVVVDVVVVSPGAAAAVAVVLVSGALASAVDDGAGGIDKGDTPSHSKHIDIDMQVSTQGRHRQHTTGLRAVLRSAVEQRHGAKDARPVGALLPKHSRHSNNSE